MASKNYEKTIKTPHWKNSKDKEWADYAKSSYLKISKRSDLSPKI